MLILHVVCRLELSHITHVNVICTRFIPLSLEATRSQNWDAEYNSCSTLRMVYIQSWQKYQEEAEVLYAKSPNKVRINVSWHGIRIQQLITGTILCEMEAFRRKTSTQNYRRRYSVLQLP